MPVKSLTKKQSRAAQPEEETLHQPPCNSITQNNESLPDGWRWVKLGEACKIVSGNTPKGLERISNKGEHHFYKVSDMNLIGNEAQMSDSNLKLTSNELEKLKIKIFPKGTVIFPKRGGAILTNKKRILSQNASFDLNLMGILPNENVSSKYLFYWMIKLDLTKIYDGSNVPQINNKNIAPLHFPLSPVAEQHAIVSKIEELLSELDKGKQQLEIAQRQLKIYRQAVLKWAFEGKLTNKNVKEGKLPEGWAWVRLGGLIEQPKYGTSKKCDYKLEGKAVLRIPNIGDGIVDISDLKFASFNKKEVEIYRLIEGDILTIRSNGSVDLVGKCALISKRDEEYLYAGYLIRLRPIHQLISSKFLFHILSSSNLRNQIEFKAKSTSGVNNINSEELKSLKIPICSMEEQQLIVQEIESRLSICDKVEETITTSLAQAETLRQSILKRAFEGQLITKKVAPVYKPKNVYFYQMQLLGYLNYYSNQKGVYHGEMTTAKFAYLMDKIYGVPTYYDYKRWHLGPYPPEMKEAIKNKDFFGSKNKRIEVINTEKLFQYTNPLKKEIERSVNELVEIFSYYPEKERAHKIELMATVCKVVEDIGSTDLKLVRESMKEWKIKLDTTHFKDKAEKFNEKETKTCLEFIVEKRWDKTLLSK